MLRSIESNVRSFVKFNNKSQRNVEVYWINYRGEKVHYSNLNPGESYNLNTFCSHPWVFICNKTGEKLFADNKSEVFQPEAWFKFITNAANGVVSVGRQEVNITYPLRSLKDCCMWNLVFLINSRDDIYDLEIPKSVRKDLLDIYKKSSRFNQDDEDEDDEDALEGIRRADDRFIM